MNRTQFQRALAVGMLFLTVAFCARAQQPAQLHPQPLQEVFQTELVYPQEKREIQLTFSPRWQSRPGRNATLFRLGIEYGLTDAWELVFDWDSFVRRGTPLSISQRGIGDCTFGSKYSFMNISDSRFHAALGIEVTFPTGDINRGLSEGFIEYEPHFLLARDIPRWTYTQLFTEIGVGLVQRKKRHFDPADDEPAAHEFFWNAGFFVPVRRWRFTAEVNWRTNRWNHSGEDHELYVTPGVAWKLPGTWEIGLGAPIGVRGNADRARLILHVVYEVALPSKEP